MGPLRGVTYAVLVAAALSAAFAASGSASVFRRCANSQSGSLLAPHWATNGPWYVAISSRTAVSIRRRVGPGVEGFRPTVADTECNVGLSVEARAAGAWVKSRRRNYSLGIRTVGAGHNIYLGTFRCRVGPAARTIHGTCTHRADRHAGRIVVRFKIVRV